MTSMASAGLQPAIRPGAAVGWWFRGGAAALGIAVGLGIVAALFGVLGWTWVLWIAVGVGGGLLAGRASLAWAPPLGVLLLLATAGPLGLPRDTGPFAWLGTAGLIVLLTLAFLDGASLAQRRSLTSPYREAWRGMGRLGRGVAGGGMALVMVGGLGYAGYIAQIGSEEFVHPAVHDPDCRTPDLLGWTYEAINYDQADDARLAASNADRTDCASQGSPAGTQVLSADGIPLAGWYVPAASGVGPTGPTLVIVPGWKTNKSGVLKYGVPFHAEYNLVFLDLRNSGRSGGTETTMGFREQLDVRAMVDWLVSAKRPSWIGLVGNSMGGATALAEAVGDQRVRALVLDSAHAEIVTSVSNVLETEHGQPAVPGGWAIVRAVSARVGGDITTVDPIRTIGRLGERRVLLIQGTGDLVDPPAEASDLNFRAAIDAGVRAELAYCQGARHGKVIDGCPADWAGWATAFLARARAAGG